MDIRDQLLEQAANSVGDMLRRRVAETPNVRAFMYPQGAAVPTNWVTLTWKQTSDIVDQLAAGDLVITADIPLAAAVLERQAHALNPRGEMYTAANIAERLSMRNFLEELRSSGVQSGGPPPLGEKERRAFANALDRLLAQRRR